MEDKQCKQKGPFSVKAKGSDYFCHQMINPNKDKVKINNVQGYDAYQTKK